MNTNKNVWGGADRYFDFINAWMAYKGLSIKEISKGDYGDFANAMLLDYTGAGSFEYDKLRTAIKQMAIAYRKRLNAALDGVAES